MHDAYQRKQVITFFMATEPGRHIPSFWLAKRFTQNGFLCVYFVVPSIEGLVRQFGFETIVVSKTEGMQEIIGWIRRCQIAKINKELENIRWHIAACNRKYHVRLACVDSLLDIFIAPNLEDGVPVLSLCTCDSYTWNSKVAPISSSMMPARTALGRALIVVRWCLEWCKRSQIFPHMMLSELLELSKVRRRVARIEGLTYEFGCYGRRLRIPRVALGTAVFGFPETPKMPSLGLCVLEERHQQSASVDVVINDVQSRKIVYCSLGTHEKLYPLRILPVVIKTARTLRDKYLFVIQTKRRHEGWINAGGCPDNVILVHQADQIALIKRSSVVITHGGYGTIKECIEYRVPVIVIPCKWDQFGNAARTVFHGIGRRLVIGDLRSESLAEAIRAIDGSNTYRENAMRLRKRIEDASEGDITTGMILKVLAEGTKDATYGAFCSNWFRKRESREESKAGTNDYKGR